MSDSAVNVKLGLARAIVEWLSHQRLLYEHRLPVSGDILVAGARISGQFAFSGCCEGPQGKAS